MEKKIAEMKKAEFIDEGYKGTADEVDKKYKCYLSKKSNDEKFERIKKMFEYVKDDPKFKELMGPDYDKLMESYGKKEKRGQVVKTDFDGMNILDVFKEYKMGVKEVCKKGYTVENDTYKKN